MSDPNVRIVDLAPMRVATFLGFGPSPEELAWKQLADWAGPKGLLQDPEAHPLFGFDNPSPSAGSPNYGYEVWIKVDPDMPAEEGVRFLDFPGGLYAVASVRPVTGEEIFPAWQQLVAWRERSPYRPAHHQWMEEHIGDIKLSFPDITLDLFLPIAE